MLGRIVVVVGLLFAPLPALAVETAPTEGQDYAACGDTGAMQKIAALYEKGTGKAGAKR